MTTLDNMNCDQINLQNTVRRRTKQETSEGVCKEIKRKAQGDPQRAKTDPTRTCREGRASSNLCGSSRAW